MKRGSAGMHPRCTCRVCCDCFFQGPSARVFNVCVCLCVSVCLCMLVPVSASIRVCVCAVLSFGVSEAGRGDSMFQESRSQGSHICRGVTLTGESNAHGFKAHRGVKAYRGVKAQDSKPTAESNPAGESKPQWIRMMCCTVKNLGRRTQNRS